MNGRPADVGAWVARGRSQVPASDRVWTLDTGAPDGRDGPPVLLVHGFPTCAWDWRHLVDALAPTRRVLTLDLPGYGSSAKPDRDYPLQAQADTVAAFVVAAGCDEVDLVTHDMGDSVGGELLARALDGTLPFRVRRRVLTNGSIYLDMAHLTVGQRLGQRLPNRRVPAVLGPVLERLYRRGLEQVFGAPPPGEIDALWTLMSQDHGHLLLPRLIRYLDGRRSFESRWTGAIERHPAPLTVVWGEEDPVADVRMVERLAQRRPDAVVEVLPGLAHFPMTQDPARFAPPVLRGLGLEA